MKRGMLWVKVAASVLFIGLLLFSLDVRELAARAKNVDVSYLAASLLFSFLMVAASTWKWWYLMRLQGFSIPFTRMFRWYFIGYFYSNFLPSNVGGDVARAWLAGRQVHAPGAALVAVFAERFTGLVFLLLMAVTLPFLAPPLWRHPAVAVGIVAGACGLAGIALAWLGGKAGMRSAVFGRAVEKIRGWVRADRPGRPRRLWEKACEKCGRFSTRAGDLWEIIRRRPAAFASVAGLTALFYGLVIGNVALGYRAFGAWPDLSALACVLPVALMVAMLPVTLGNLGIAEGSYVFYFGLIGMGRELTLAMGLLLRMKIIILGVIGMLVQAGEHMEGLPRRDEPPEG
ncbi:MAG TPA: hypothetical protein DCM68_02740 [Verrucomicrobia bacterium]|nr:hypothetical protein [Verrucomicrobiota bacterium]